MTSQEGHVLRRTRSLRGHTTITRRLRPAKSADEVERPVLTNDRCYRD